MKKYNIKVTNFFSKYMKQKGADLDDCIAISNSVPKWFTGKHMKQLSPGIKHIDHKRLGKITDTEYAQAFLNYSEKKFREGKLDMLNILEQLDNKTICILETADKFSHYKVLEFLFQKAGYNVNMEVMQ